MWGLRVSMSINIKNNILLAFTGMLFSIVHTLIKGGEDPLRSSSLFLSQWFIHYLVVCLICAFAYGFTAVLIPYFYKDEKIGDIVSIDKYITIYSLVVIVILTSSLLFQFN